MWMAPGVPGLHRLQPGEALCSINFEMSLDLQVMVVSWDVWSRYDTPQEPSTVDQRGTGIDLGATAFFAQAHPGATLQDFI